MFKTENQCKISQAVDQMLAHTLPLEFQLSKVNMIVIDKNRGISLANNFSWYAIEFIDIAKDFPGIIHDSRVLRYTAQTRE